MGAHTGLASEPPTYGNLSGKGRGTPIVRAAITHIAHCATHASDRDITRVLSIHEIPVTQNPDGVTYYPTATLQKCLTLANKYSYLGYMSVLSMSDEELMRPEGPSAHMSSWSDRERCKECGVE